MAHGDLYISKSREVKLYTRGSYSSLDGGMMLWTAA